MIAHARPTASDLQRRRLLVDELLDIDSRLRRMDGDEVAKRGVLGHRERIVARIAAWDAWFDDLGGAEDD